MIYPFSIDVAMSLCIKNGIKVYPIVFGKYFKIQVDDNGKLITYPTVIKQAYVNSAQSKTYKYFATKIMAQKKENNA